MRIGKRLLALVLAVTLVMSCGISTALAAGGTYVNSGDSGKDSGTLSAVLTYTPVTIKAKETATANLAIKLTKKDGTYEDVKKDFTATYTSKTPELATVDADGKVTGVAKGSAEITVAVVYNGLTANATATIPVEDAAVTPTEEFEVSFDTDGGSANPATQKIKKDGLVAAVADPTKNDHKFLGWFNGNSSTKWDFAKDKVQGKMTLTAKWEAVATPGQEKIDVTSVTYGGNNQVKVGESTGVPSVVTTYTDAKGASKPVAATYSYKITAGDTNATIAANGVVTGKVAGTVTVQVTAKYTGTKALTATKNVTITVVKGGDKPTVETVDVTIDPNNGSDKTVVQYEVGATITEPVDPVKKGFVFAGWYNGDKPWDFENDTVEGEMTLTAMWEVVATEADLAALQAAVDAAKLSAKQIVTSVDGRDVAANTKWVTAKDKKAFTDAIALVEKVLNYEGELGQAFVQKLTVAMKADHATFLKLAKYGTRSSGSSSSGGGSSSSGSTSTPSAPSQPTSKEVNSDGSVNAADTAQAATSAIQNALASNNTNASVVIENAKSISSAALKDIADAAKAAGGNVKLNFDTTVDGKTVARIAVDPAKAAALGKDINLGVAVDEATTAPVTNHFSQYFANDVAAVSFAQAGEFGMTVDVAVRVDVSKIDLNKLQVYSYDRATNKYVKVNPGKVFVDKNGFLHFQTNRGGDLLFSNGPLTAK